jgi:parallel beta-helix repeat protein
VRNVGNHGIVVDGGQGCEIVRCDVYHCGDSGICLSGGERKTLQASHHRAADNHVHHMGEWSRSYQPGLRVTGVGQRLEHNHVHDGPHNGILLSGNEHIIEYNHVHHVCQETGDVGAFYMGRDWTERGNVLRYNFFHHTQGVGMGSMAVYLDDCASGTTIFGNIFYQCTRAVFIGGGRNNRVENNIFVDCDPAIQIDGRGLDPKPVWRHMVDQVMRGRLDAVDHRQPPYSTRYPDLKQLYPYYAENVGIPPEGNLIVRNICRGSWLNIHWHAKTKSIAIQNNMTEDDPLFVDAEGLDFQLRVDSPAYELGFKRIPVDKIGPRRDVHAQTPI